MIDITTGPLALEPLVDAVSHERCGAVVAFLGLVRRDSDEGRTVEGLTYEAYPRMALPLMRDLARETEQRFAGARLAMVHRIGSVAIGEPSVAVAASAPHRLQAFEACRYAIDELKRRIPIWKKEHYVGGDARWRENAPA
jgi:molybdopterin synthase catalytic subunit